MQPRTPAAIDGLGLSLFKRGKNTCGGEGWRHDGKPQLVRERHLGVVPLGPDPKPGGASRTLGTCKGMFFAYTQGLHDLGLPEEGAGGAAQPAD